MAAQVTSDHQAQVPGKGEQGAIVCPMDPRQDEAERKRSERRMGKKASHVEPRAMRNDGTRMITSPARGHALGGQKRCREAMMKSPSC